MLQGIPLHPLAVHFGVVLGLLAAGALLLAAVLPRFRHWLGWGLPALGLAGGVALRVTQSFGEILAESAGEYDNPLVHQHAEWGERAGTAGIAIAVVAVLLWLLTAAYPRQRWTGSWPAWLTRAVTVLAVIVPIVAIGVVTLAGHTGARAVWTG